MIKKVIVIVLLFFSLAKAQGYMNFDYMQYYDSKIVYFLKTISKEMGAEKFLVFQSVMTGLERNNELVTFVITEINGGVTARMITGRYIYSPVPIRNSKIFDSRFNSAGVHENENKLKKIPKTLDPFKGSDIVLYYSNNAKFFFEAGHPQNYIEDKNKAKIRKDWTGLIRQELLANIKYFKKETFYNRNTDYSMVEEVKKANKKS
jgi:hypothetical protein